MAQRELFELKKELEARRIQIVKLDAELKEKDKQVITLQHLARQGEEKTKIADSSMAEFSRLLEEATQSALEREKNKLGKYLQDLETENANLKRENEDLRTHKARLIEKDAEIEFLTNKIQEVAGGYGRLESIKDLRGQRSDNLALRKDVEDRTKELTLLSKQTQEIMAENRVLREMAGVPANYGFDLDSIKLVEQQKIEEYKGRVTRLEQEVEDLEKTRTELLYKLRKFSTLYGEKGVRFHSLSAEQMRLVDEFAHNLREGRVEVPMTDRSKELLREVDKLKYQLQLLENSRVGAPASQLNDELLEHIRQENKEVKELLLKLYSSGYSGTPREIEEVSRHVLQLPPVPISNSIGDFNEGFSYRFNQKLPVAEIWTGDAKRDLAGLQLQIVELIELLNRRDEDEKLTGFELEEFRGKLREVLLVQEELFKDFVQCKQGFAAEAATLQQQYEIALQELREARAQIGVYEDMTKALKNDDSKQLKAKISDMASKLALLEVNNLRLSRKYDIINSEEKDLRQAYHAIEAEHAEKDVIIAKRIGRLKEWRVSATYQLQFLFRQLRTAVPLDKYEQALHKLDILKEQQAAWLIREADLYKRLSNFESKERENLDLNEKLRQAQELRLELEGELEMICRRLENMDPIFKLEQTVFKRVVQHLKTKHISPEQAFSMFDKNADGRISRLEFRSALESMGLRLSNPEFDSLRQTFEYDGEIRYKEFIRKLQVFGVQSISEEQQVLQIIYDGIKRLNYTLYEVFQIFDKDDDGLISRQDLFESLTNFGLGLTRTQMERFAKLIDTNRDGSIEFQEFSAVFERKMENLEPQPQTNWKDELFARIAEAAAAHNMNIEDAFAAFDNNKDGRISKIEFANAFTQMGANLSRAQLDELWSSMNSDGDGSISYPEFIAQFKKSTRQQETAKIIAEAERATSTNVSLREKRQVAVLEAREAAALSKAERYQTRMKHLEASLSENERQFARLEQSYLDLTKNYHILREEDAERRIRLANTVSKSEAESLRQSNETLRKELAEARAAMMTYKALVNATADQAKSLKLILEKRKDEIQTFQEALRELSADNSDATTVGKLYHSVMVSRWAEASANRKYDGLLEETRTLRSELFRIEGEMMDKEKMLYDVQQVLTEKISSYEERIRDLQSTLETNVKLDKVNELVAQIRELGDKKSELEEINRNLTVKIAELDGIVDEARIMKKSADEIFDTIRRGHPDEVSAKLVELAERASELRLGELKAKREMNLSKEREEYLSRLHTQDLSAIKSLEEEVSKWEGILARKEEIWRKKDDERQKMLLNPKFQFALPAKDSMNVRPETRRNEEELLNLRERIRALEGSLKLKQEQIEYLSKIRQETSHLPLGEVSRIRSDAETDAIAHAANHTISTLQELLDNKTAQLQRAETTIDRLREDLSNTQKQAGIEIQRLVSELKEATDGHSAHLLTAIDSVSQRPKFSGYRPDIDKAIAEKDQKIAELYAQVETLVSSREQTESLLQHLRTQLDQTKQELHIQLNKKQGPGNKKELDLLRKKLQIKDQELHGMKQSLAALKNDLLKAAESNEAKEAELRKTSRDPANSQMLTQNLRRAETRATALNKQVKELREENEKLKNANSSYRESEAKLRSEGERSTSSLAKRQDSLDRTVRENKALEERQRKPKDKPDVPRTMRKP